MSPSWLALWPIGQAQHMYVSMSYVCLATSFAFTFLFIIYATCSLIQAFNSASSRFLLSPPRFNLTAGSEEQRREHSNQVHFAWQLCRHSVGLGWSIKEFKAFKSGGYM
jgi:hypothetical protein